MAGLSLNWRARLTMSPESRVNGPAPLPLPSKVAMTRDPDELGICNASRRSTKTSDPRSPRPCHGRYWFY